MLTRDKEMIDMQDGAPRCCDYLRGCQGRWTLVRWNLMGFLMNGLIEFKYRFSHNQLSKLNHKLVNDL